MEMSSTKHVDNPLRRNDARLVDDECALCIAQPPKRSGQLKWSHLLSRSNSKPFVDHEGLVGERLRPWLNDRSLL